MALPQITSSIHNDKSLLGLYLPALKIPACLLLQAMLCSDLAVSLKAFMPHGARIRQEVTLAVQSAFSMLDETAASSAVRWAELEACAICSRVSARARGSKCNKNPIFVTNLVNSSSVTDLQNRQGCQNKLQDFTRLGCIVAA